MVSYLFVSIFEIQSIPWHLPAVLPKLIIVKVGTDEDDIQEVALGSILEPLVPVNQLWGKLPIKCIHGTHHMQEPQQKMEHRPSIKK